MDIENTSTEESSGTKEASIPLPNEPNDTFNKPSQNVMFEVSVNPFGGEMEPEKTQAKP